MYLTVQQIKLHWGQKYTFKSQHITDNKENYKIKN